MRKDRLYFQLSLRQDLATLIFEGLDRAGMSQEALARASGKKPSYISRLVNGSTNCKLAAVAQVLVPLGIEPMIVDKAEFDRLRDEEQRAKRHKTESLEAVNKTFSDLRDAIHATIISKSTARLRITPPTDPDVQGGRIGQVIAERQVAENPARSAAGTAHFVGGSYEDVCSSGYRYKLGPLDIVDVHSAHTECWR